MNASEEKNTLLLLSGGMDSVALLYLLHSQKHDLECVFFNYGANHMTQERRFAKQHCVALNIPLHRVELPKLCGSQLVGDKQPSWVVPGRNSILLSHAANLAAANGFQFVAYGCNADDAEEFPDCRYRFANAFRDVFHTSELGLQLLTPFLHMTKRDIADMASRNSFPITESWSCYSDHLEPCGVCPACQKRNAAIPCV